MLQAFQSTNITSIGFNARKFEKQILSISEKKISLAKRKQILRGGSFLKNFLDGTLPSLILALAQRKRK